MGDPNMDAVREIRQEMIAYYNAHPEVTVGTRLDIRDWADRLGKVIQGGICEGFHAEPEGKERTLRDAAILFAIEVEAQELDPDGPAMRKAWDALRVAAERYTDDVRPKAGRPAGVKDSQPRLAGTGAWQRKGYGARNKGGSNAA